ncbi:peritrophin-1-like [Odontomachus brunneus]|uniref:peritrophin-1-like n=1 Tax=Odontomachus brunneus TaxID=486640 RepID=UPI0013F29B40|nr:peritrophin-1-like [Odontomachus brunneus]
MKAILSVALLMCLAMVYSYTEANFELDCPIPNKENATLLPHPTNCNSYFVCETGEPIPMTCPKGLHFNPKLSVCDWPWRAHCKARG